MSEVKAETLELSKVISAGMQIDEAGKVTYSENVYEDALKHLNVELEHAKKVNAANVAIAVANAHAGGLKAIPVLAKNKELERVTGSLRQGNAEIWFDTRRETSTRNPRTGETGTSYGATQIGISLKGIKGAQATAVKKELQELAAQKFGKK